MSDLYTLSDDELLQTDLSSLDEQTNDNDATNSDTQADTEQEVVDGTDTPNEPQESVESHTEPSDDATDTNADDTADTGIDYEAFYTQMTKPFKANGREISINNADDAIRLMQMGANYSKKMEQLKPKQALLKFLEENQLDNTEQLGYLVDLVNKKPEAIAKLIKEADIDLYDFDTQQAEGYTPNVELPETSLFEDTLQELLLENSSMGGVVNQMVNWDSQSKEVIYNEPSILRVFSEHKANGLYDKIVDTIETERMLGRLQGIPYIQAYAQVEQQLTQNNATTFTAPRPTNSKPDSNLDKKKQASLPKGNPAQPQEQFNPLTVSDEELLKLMANH